MEFQNTLLWIAIIFIGKYIHNLDFHTSHGLWKFLLGKTAQSYFSHRVFNTEIIVAIYIFCFQYYNAFHSKLKSLLIARMFLYYSEVRKELLKKNYPN